MTFDLTFHDVPACSSRCEVFVTIKSMSTNQEAGTLEEETFLSDVHIREEPSSEKRASLITV